MVKHYLRKAAQSLILTLFFISIHVLVPSSVWAADKVNISPLFVELSDAMQAADAEDSALVLQHVEKLQAQFDAIPTRTSAMGQSVTTALHNAKQTPDKDTLVQLSTALLAFEKEQNPIDVAKQKRLFKKQVVPAFTQFNNVVNASDVDVEALRSQLRIFTIIWVKNERLVRNVNVGDYGNIETALSLLRVAIETDPVDMLKVQQRTKVLGEAFDAYLNSDNVVQTEVHNDGNLTLSDGIALLEDGLNHFQNNQISDGQDKLTKFIQIWPTIEGEVKTRSGSLYNRVESNVPIILARGDHLEQQKNLQALIGELQQINAQTGYNTVDAALILLREGLEAMLVVLALVGALRAAGQTRGYKWIGAGVVFGLIASLAVAFIFKQFLPQGSSAVHREMLEGFVGIVAVVMIITIGAWLHSKSSVQSWQAYIKRHMGAALTTGSFVSLFGLSFLSVFREGAETTLFYIGILPSISMNDFILGICVGIFILVILALILLKGSVNLPVPTMFKILTWVLYVLGFKILGLSIHALQITHVVSTNIINGLPNIEWLGFFANIETVMAQLVYIFAILGLQKVLHRHDKKVS